MTYPSATSAAASWPGHAAVPQSVPSQQSVGGAAINRFGQLTYSSFDDGSGVGGGWQVKDITGGLTDTEREQLRFWVQTTFELPKPLPQFPTPEDVARFPRRLMYTRLPDGRAGYWHTVPAGADGSGRPGNVFAHTVLDRGPDATDVDLRPIDLWRSSDWLCPYGAADVVEAKLSTAALPASGSVVNRQSVIEFLCDPAEWRIGVLSVLLDAVAAALAGGPAVVFGAHSDDTAAMWIGAVSHLMSAGTARRFGWSTFDRAAGVPASLGRGVVLTAVPIGDVGAVAGAESLVVLRENEVPAIGDLGGAPHRTAAGSEVPVTEWSVIAQSAVVDHETFDHALRVLDDVARSVADTGLDPAWPLAMAAALIEELRDDVGAEAGAVIARHSPDDLSAKPELAERASAAIADSLGTSAADAWKVLGTAKGSSSRVALEMLAAVYVERALSDRQWLIQAGGVPFVMHRLREHWRPERLDRQITAHLDALSEQFREASHQGFPTQPEQVFAVFRSLDLLVRANCLDSVSYGGLSSLERAQNLLEMAVVPTLVDPGSGPGFVAACGPLDERTARALVRPVLASAAPMNRGTLGQRSSTEVLTWLMPPSWDELPSARQLAELPVGEIHPLAVLTAELASQHMADSKMANRWMHLNWLVLWRLLAQHGEPDVQAPDVKTVFAAAFPPAALNPLLARYPGIVPPRYFMSTFMFEPLTDDYRRLPASILAPARPGSPPPLAGPGEWDAIASAIYHVRVHSAWHLMSREERTALQKRFLGPALRRVAPSGGSRVSGDLAHSLAVLSVAEAVDDPSRSDILEAAKIVVQQENAANRARLVAAVADLTRSEGLSVGWLVEAAVVGGDQAPERRLARPIERFLGTLARDVDDRHVSLLDEVVERLVEQNRYIGPAEPAAIERALVERVRRTYGGEEDKILSLYRKYAKKWLEDRGIEPGGVRTRRRR
ncbi:hypothetical protein [Antrihabitans stalactiti]|uniref:Uncharacterized protein n=1 Tax=Antrihabitans stalactiti TaxID=2584121 RepID=A0A848K7V4_9NOCA|nr:hypothetical protein [Antrihabitans stalactiti]NMN95065.1 hypothetical protein [Antrihabitans stalactiti]